MAGPCFLSQICWLSYECSVSSCLWCRLRPANPWLDCFGALASTIGFRFEKSPSESRSVLCRQFRACSDWLRDWSSSFCRQSGWSLRPIIGAYPYTSSHHFCNYYCACCSRSCSSDYCSESDNVAASCRSPAHFVAGYLSLPERLD